MIWNLNDWQVLHELRGHTHYIQAVAFSNSLPRESSAAESDSDVSPRPDKQRIVDSTSLSAETCEFLEVVDPAIVPCDFRVASGARDNSVCVWDVIAGHLVFVVVSQFWDTSSTEYLAVGCLTRSIGQRDHSNWVNDLQFHPDGRYLLSASGRIKDFGNNFDRRTCLLNLEISHR